MVSALNRDCVMPPHSIRFELSLVLLQLALSPMRVFVRSIERPFDVTVQGFHDADARKHRWPVMIGEIVDDGINRPILAVRHNRRNKAPGHKNSKRSGYPESLSTKAARRNRNRLPPTIGGVKMRISIALLALFAASTVYAETSSVSCTGPLHTVVIQKRQFDVVTDGERVCMIPWGSADHDPLRGLCQYAEVADVPCTISGSYVRRGKIYELGDDWTATPGTKETKRPRDRL
jgi:hypothetical protein